MEIKRKADENGPAQFPLHEGYCVTINDETIQHSKGEKTYIAILTEDGKKNLGHIVIEGAVLRILPSGDKLGDSYTYVLPFGKKK